jgi:hypothetical protein
MGASAVPQSTVAIQPALQWVRMLTVSPGFAGRDLLDELQPVAPDGLVGGHVLIANFCSAGIGCLQPVLAGQVAHTAEHLVQRPHQVDGRGPCPAQARVGRFKRLVGCIFAQARHMP